MEFRETQRFNQWWLWLILAGTVLLVIFGILMESLKNEPSEDQISSLMLSIIILIPLLLMYLFFKIRLITLIDEAGIHFRWTIFMRNFKTYNWNEIDEAKLLKYHFVGYGLRLSFKYGIVHNTSGNKGLFIKLKNGNKRMFGTNKPEELKSFLQELDKNIPENY